MNSKITAEIAITFRFFSHIYNFDLKIQYSTDVLFKLFALSALT